jgi:hypothetical protein
LGNDYIAPRAPCRNAASHTSVPRARIAVAWGDNLHLSEIYLTAERERLTAAG